MGWPLLLFASLLPWLLRPTLMPRPTTATTATLLPTAMVTFPTATLDTTLATTTARGPLMPSLLLMPTLVLATTATLLWPLLPLLCPPSTEVPSTDSPMAATT